jgi:Zn-dependent M28 family amino/carboxypeptidase
MVIAMKLFRSVAAAAALLAALGACRGPDAGGAKIDAGRISADIRALSSDDMEGRGPATRAEPKVIDYVTRQFQAMGLEPAGENGGWTQAVPMVSFQVQAPVKLSLRLNGASQVLAQGEQAVVQSLVPVDHVAIEAAPMVFVGYGVLAPERHWDDFKGVDLHGKIAVILINDPDFENPSSRLFGGRAMTYYGRWTYKYEEAARQGALGALIVHETAPAAYGWATVKNSNTNAQFDIVRKDPSMAHPLLQGWIQRDVALGLFKACGLDFEAEKRAAMKPDFRPRPLDCARFSADYPLEHQQVVSHNILARRPGKSRPAQSVIYSAHWDHLGIGPPDARGDRIFNGALDNASGVADVLEIARAFARAPRTDRSVLFLITTAEEKNLLGSLYYATHPLYPLESTVADINIDDLDAAGLAHDVAVRGGNQTTLEGDLAALAKQHGRGFSTDPDPGAGYFYRADHFSFAKAGVPAVSLNSGRDLVKGGRKAGDAWHAEYVAHRYHQPADEWSPDMNLEGQVADIELAYELGRNLADGDAWPQWTATSEFKAIRDASAARRK